MNDKIVMLILSCDSFYSVIDNPIDWCILNKQIEINKESSYFFLKDILLNIYHESIIRI